MLLFTHYCIRLMENCISGPMTGYVGWMKLVMISTSSVFLLLDAKRIFLPI